MTLEAYAFGLLTFLFGCMVTGFGYSYAFSNRLTKMEGTLTNVCTQINDLREGKVTVVCPKHEDILKQLSDERKRVDDILERR